MSDFKYRRNRLDRIAAKFWRDCEHADADLDGFNDHLRRASAAGVLGPTAVLGPVVLTRPYPAGGPTAGGQAVQVVLAFPGGFGAVYWDTEDLAALGDDAGRAAAALRAVVPYEECEPAVRALVGRHAEGLLRRLLAMIGP